MLAVMEFFFSIMESNLIELDRMRKYAETVSQSFREGAPQLRKDLVLLLFEQGSFISEHFGLGMSLRNFLRKECPKLVEEEAQVEHLLDDNWQRILLCALELTEDELEQIPMKEWLTNSDECIRDTALRLQEIYGVGS